MHARWSVFALGAAALACSNEEVGLGRSKGVARLSPARIAFGSVYAGQEVHAQVAVTASGGSVQILSEGIDGSPEVTIDGPELPIMVPADGAVSFDLVFAARSLGSLAATFTVYVDVDIKVLHAPITAEVLAGADCDDHNDCTIDQFDPFARACRNIPREGSCDDGNACTSEDRCRGGVCVGQSVRCDDGVDCTQDSCDPNRGCVFRPNDTACADSNPCTVDRCGADGCHHDGRPNGTVCGTVVPCVSAEVCILNGCMEVSIPEGSPCDDRDGCTVRDHCAQGRCQGEPLATPPSVLADSYLVASPTGGAFIDTQTLYLSAPVGDRQTVKVVAIDPSRAAPIAAPLDGSGDLAPLGGSLFARTHTATNGELSIETIDTAQATAPRIVARRSLGLLAPPPEASAAQAHSIAGGRLFFCARRSALAIEPSLFEVDLSNPLQPSGSIAVGGPREPCAGAIQGATATVAAAGPIWLRFGTATGTASIEVIDVSQGQARSALELSIRTDGVPRYGAITSVALDETRAWLGFEDPRYALLLDFDAVATGGAASSALVHTHSGGPNRPRLMHRGVAYLESAGALFAYDTQLIDTPMILPYGASIPSDRQPLRALASSDAWLAFGSVDGGLLIVPTTSIAGTRPDPLVVGDGHLERLVSLPPDQLGLSSSGFFRFDPISLMHPTAATTPTRARALLSAPVALDGPSAPVGIFSPRDSSQALALPLLRSPAPTIDHLQISERSRVVIGRALPVDWPPGAERIAAIAVDGCRGAAIATGSGAPLLLSLDRCGQIGVAVIGAIPFIALDATLEPLNAYLHEAGDFATFTNREGAALVDLRVPGLPAIAGVRPPSLPPMHPTGAGYEGGTWVLTGFGASSAMLEVYDVSGAGALLQSAVALPPEPSSLDPRVLALHWPLTLLSSSRPGQELRIYDLRPSPPQLIHSLALPTPPIDTVLDHGRAYIARFDGISVVEPICPP